MFAIETPAKWWDLVDSYWDDLISLIKDNRLGDRVDELDRCRRMRDRRLTDHLVNIRRIVGRHGRRQHHHTRQLLTDLCLDRSILYQAVVWRG